MGYTILLFIFCIISLIILEYALQDRKKVGKIMSILNIRNKKKCIIFFVIGLVIICIPIYLISLIFGESSTVNIVGITLGLSISGVTQAMFKTIKSYR